MEILLKLPVKSLIRFRCVCKHWSSSLQSPQFIAEHHRTNLQSNNLHLLVKSCHPAVANGNYLSILLVQQRESYFVSENVCLRFYHEKMHLGVGIDVCGPSNGLFCLGVDEEHVLWNPSTREFKILLKSTVERPPNARYSSFHVLGYGFDSKTGDYKVVRFVTSCFNVEDYWGGWIVQVEIYSLKSDSWKEISATQSCATPSPLLSKDLNGFYYWQTGGLINGGILSFDMANEEYSVLPIRNFDEYSQGYEWHILEFNISLGVIVYPWEGAYKSMDLWVMNDSWTRQFSIEVIPEVDRSLGFWKNSQMFFESSSHELILFDYVTREFKNLGIYSYRREMELITYVESLVPING